MLPDVYGHELPHRYHTGMLANCSSDCRHVHPSLGQATELPFGLGNPKP